MKSNEIKWLEKVWIAEIEDRLPFQSKAAIMKRMEADNLVCQMSVKMGGRFPVTVNGWQLTHLGRFFYCDWATQQPDELDTTPSPTSKTAVE